jgi:alpha-L-rhamnosidase
MFLQVMVPANTFAVISLTNVNPDCIQDLKKYVSEKGYADLHYYEEERRIQFMTGSGRIKIEYKINDFCKINGYRVKT